MKEENNEFLTTQIITYLGNKRRLLGNIKEEVEEISKYSSTLVQEYIVKLEARVKELLKTDVVDENSYIHMTEQDYSLNLTDAFLEYISNSQYVDGAQECPKPDYLKILKI